MTVRTVIRTRTATTPSLMGMGAGAAARKWWEVGSGWARLAEVSMRAALESDQDYEERELARLIGADNAGRLRAYTNAVLLGQEPYPAFPDRWEGTD